jgi:hypothetical protein
MENPPANTQPQAAIAGQEGVVVAGHIFKPVVFGKGTLHKLSQREARLLDKFLETSNIELAAEEIGVTAATARGYLKRAHIKAYIQDMLKQAAQARGLTLDKLMSKLHQGIEGEIALTGNQLEMIKTAAKILKPSTPGVQINVQNNTYESNFSGMTPDQLTAAMRDRLTSIPGSAA